MGIAERKAVALGGEMEESRSLLDSSLRSVRQLEGELADARNSVNEMQTVNNREMASKRALEGNLHTLQAEIDATMQVQSFFYFPSDQRH